MQYITTKTLGPTSTKGARVVACASYAPAKVTLAWDYAVEADANHDAAAKALAEKLGWKGQWVRGGSNTGNVYVATDAHNKAFSL